MQEKPVPRAPYPGLFLCYKQARLSPRPFPFGRGEHGFYTFQHPARLSAGRSARAPGPA